MSTSETDVARNAEAANAAARRALDEGEPFDLEREIDSTRAEVRADLEALERRLSFDRLLELTLGRVRERGGEFAGNLTDAATQNPVPLLLTSIGLGWMMLTSRRNGRHRPAGAPRDAHAGDTASSAAHEIGEQVRNAARSSSEALGQAAESMRAGASQAAAATREQADYARERVQRLLEEQPLMIGALGLVAGAVIGAILPATETEDRFVGEVRDQAVRAAARTNRQRYEAAREHAATYSAPEGDADSQSQSRPH